MFSLKTVLHSQTLLLSEDFDEQWEDRSKFIINCGVSRCRSLLRHCATNRKVAGSIPDGSIGVFRWLNPSGRTTTLGLSQPLTQIITRNISLGWGWWEGFQRAGLTTIPPSCADCPRNPAAWTSWNPQGLSRDSVTVYLCIINYETRQARWQTGISFNLVAWVIFALCLNKILSTQCLDILINYSFPYSSRRSANFPGVL